MISDNRALLEGAASRTDARLPDDWHATHASARMGAWMPTVP